MLKFILLTTAAIAAVSPAFAEDNSENVIVTATRLATPQSQIASSVSVVTAADIESRQQVSLPDVLRDVPGLNIVQTGGEGGQTSIFSRGTNSNHTKILVDGIDVADPSTPTNVFDFGKLNAADIARVEVLRGPGSGLYGSDAIGGVINVITKAGEGPLAATAHLEGGSFDTFNQDATAGGSDDGFHYRFTLAHQHAGDTPVTPSSLLLPGEKANGDFYDSVSGSTKLGYDVTDYFNLGFVGRASNILEKITGDGFNFKTFTGFPSPTQSRIAAVQYDARGTAHLVLGLLDQTIGLAYSSSATANADPNNGNSRNSGARVKLDWQGNIALANDETLVLGAETARDAIHLPLSAGITTNAGYAELQSALGDFDNSVSVRYDDNSRFGNKVTWRLAPVYKVGGTRLKASIGSGFKAPSLEDLFGPFGHNPGLKPETSIGYDMGLDQQLGTDFDIKEFHDVVLGSGAVPLDILERNVNQWISGKLRQQRASLVVATQNSTGVASSNRRVFTAGAAEANLIEKAEPVYPPMAKTAHVQGDVVLWLTINEKGEVKNMRAVSGHPILIQAAMDAVKLWRYKPFLINGEPVEAETTATVKFHM